MKNYFSIAFLIIILTSISSAQETINATLMHDNIEREYIIYIPEKYNSQEAVPMVLNFHGYTSSATQQLFYGDFRSIADRENFIVVHPQGTLDAFGNAHFNVGWGGSQIDDVGFTSALIDHIASTYNINLKRVYSTGMSNGGFMSYHLACNLSDKIAAIASVTGSMSMPTFDNCALAKAVPILEIHGNADAVVPYDGSAIALPIEDVISFWITQNNCSETPITTPIEDIDTTDGSTVIHFIYQNGTNGSSVEHFFIDGGGHTWPGSNFLLDQTNYDIDASQEIWRFFSQYDLDGIIESNSIEILSPKSNFQIYPNPTTDFLDIIKEDATFKEYYIFSAQGKLMQTGTIEDILSKIEISNLSKGVYFFTLGTHLKRFVVL